jgi:hypothetical protein
MRVLEDADLPARRPGEAEALLSMNPGASPPGKSVLSMMLVGDAWAGSESYIAFEVTSPSLELPAIAAF